MIKLLLFFALSILLISQDLYLKEFGNKQDPTIIFLHGGPGYNSSMFEYLAAEKLSNEGFFVICYDRRGEGRSQDPNAKYNFAQSIEDINSILNNHDIKKVNLIGHSFGGVLAVKYAQSNPEKTNSIILVGAAINFQQTFKNIISKSKNIYQEKGDAQNLKYISMLENIDTTSMQYATYSFMHAMQNGFYSAANPNKVAQEIYSSISSNHELMKYVSLMDRTSPQAWQNNEKYTLIDTKVDLKKLKESGMNIFALYGKEDGLFSPDQVMELSNILDKDHLLYLDNCSHNVFIDQQKIFLSSIEKWIK